MFHKEVISQIKEILKVGVEESTQFKYLGMNVVDEEKGQIFLDQNECTRERKNMRELSGGEQRNYKSILGQLNWLAQNTKA